MPNQPLHTLFPFGRLLKLLLGLSVVIQVVVITYNHLSGYHVLDGPEQFLLRFLRGMVLSMTAAFLIAYPDLLVIRYLNGIAPWSKQLLKRIAIQFSLSVVIAMVVSTAITSLAHWISAYREDFTGVLISNALIFAVVNILMVAILEGTIFFSESRKAEQKARNLQKELSQIKFEVLKSQINPHFMFNSLNVLSGLIDKDTEKAQEFIDEFSHIYRYVLESIEQPVSTLEKELDFMRSYLFLQQIRYGEDLTYSVNIPSHLLKRVLPPLSLQVVLENAIKHNIINDARPLRIEVYSEENCLVVRNTIQPKISMGTTTGVGQTNLTKRYELIHQAQPVFTIEDNYYTAKLPLIETEPNERTHH